MASNTSFRVRQTCAHIRQPDTESTKLSRDNPGREIGRAAGSGGRGRGGRAGGHAGTMTQTSFRLIGPQARRRPLYGSSCRAHLSRRSSVQFSSVQGSWRQTGHRHVHGCVGKAATPRMRMDGLFPPSSKGPTSGGGGGWNSPKIPGEYLREGGETFISYRCGARLGRGRRGMELPENAGECLRESLALELTVSSS